MCQAWEHLTYNRLEGIVPVQSPREEKVRGRVSGCNHPLPKMESYRENTSFSVKHSSLTSTSCKGVPTVHRDFFLLESWRLGTRIRQVRRVSSSQVFQSTLEISSPIPCSKQYISRGPFPTRYLQETGRCVKLTSKLCSVSHTNFLSIKEQN